eukprot:7010860-Pyramimonas_sp.AAC.1
MIKDAPRWSSPKEKCTRPNDAKWKDGGSIGLRICLLTTSGSSRCPGGKAQSKDNASAGWGASGRRCAAIATTLKGP